MTIAPIVARLSAAVRNVLADPAVSKRLADQGTAPSYLDTDAFAGYIRTEAARWAEVIDKAGIKVE